MPINKLVLPEQLAAYSSELPGLDEQRRWSLYDSVLFAAGAAILGDVNLFTLPIGQGAVAKTLRETNMRQAGQLAARQAMLIYDIGIQIEPVTVTEAALIATSNATTQFVHDALYGASFTFRNTQKTDLEIAPLAKLPAGYGVTASLSYSGIVTGGGYYEQNNGHPSRAALWDLDPLPIVILPQRSFGVTLNFPVAVTVPAALTGGARIWCHLDGVLFRSA